MQIFLRVTRFIATKQSIWFFTRHRLGITRTVVEAKKSNHIKTNQNNAMNQSEPEVKTRD